MGSHSPEIPGAFNWTHPFHKTGANTFAVNPVFETRWHFWCPKGDPQRSYLGSHQLDPPRREAPASERPRHRHFGNTCFPASGLVALCPLLPRVITHCRSPGEGLSRVLSLSCSPRWGLWPAPDILLSLLRNMPQEPRVYHWGRPSLSKGTKLNPHL